MIIQDTRDKVLSLVDEKTVRRLRTSLDYVIKTEDNGILLSSRWIDNSPMLIYSTSSETHFWAKNKDIRELAKDADDSKGNELFEAIGDRIEKTGKLRGHTCFPQ